MKCFVCGSSPGTDGETLFRVNATGVKGIWACRKHVKNTDAPKDEALVELVSIIERGNLRRSA